MGNEYQKNETEGVEYEEKGKMCKSGLKHNSVRGRHTPQKIPGVDPKTFEE